MTPDPGERLVVGRVGRAHGLRGEVAVTFTSNRPERAAPGAVLFVGERELTIDASRPHQGRMLVHFAGVDDRTAADLDARLGHWFNDLLAYWRPSGAPPKR